MRNSNVAAVAASEYGVRDNGSAAAWKILRLSRKKVCTKHRLLWMAHAGVTAYNAARHGTQCPELPYNFEVNGPWVGRPRHEKIEGEEGERFARLAARSTGWLLELAEGAARGEYRLVVRLFRRTIAYGMNARAMFLPIWRVLEKFSSPGKLERWLRKVIHASDKILARITGRTCPTSWKGLALALNGSLVPRRAAWMAAYRTVEGRIWRRLRLGLTEIVRWQDARLRLAKMTQAGLRDILTTEDEVFPWPGERSFILRMNGLSSAPSVAERGVKAVALTAYEHVWRWERLTQGGTHLEAHVELFGACPEQLIHCRHAALLAAARQRARKARLFRLVPVRTEEDQLLAEIRGEPNNEALTGIYADWLEDHGRLEEACQWRYNRYSLVSHY